MAVQNDMTADFLRSAYGGESMAHMRYLIWGNMAGKEGFANVKRLFEAIAYSEWAHANNHFRELGERKGGADVSAGAVFGAGKTVDNLQGAIDGELHEVNQMYPVFLEAARFQNEKGAERAFSYALEAEKIHAKLFKEAQDQVRQGKDMELGAVHVCPVCGYTGVGEAPDVCPICGASKDKFRIFA